jgi:hypothetical protein
MGPSEPPRVVGDLACADGWVAARLLLALAAEDAKTPGARALAADLRRVYPSDEAFARGLHDYVKKRVKFVREAGEIFQSGAFTLRNGAGDCDCHFRLLYALAVAGGLPAKLGLLHHGEDAPPDMRGPAHAATILCPRGHACSWAETTIDAFYGETPNEAADRLGLTNERSDIAREVVVMSEKDLPPIPAGFRERNDPARVRIDAEALRSLGYLPRDAPESALSDPADPMLREAVLAFQLAHGLTPDGLLGDHETRPAIARVIREEGIAGFDQPSIGALVPTSQTADVTDEFLQAVQAFAARFRAKGAAARVEDWLVVWLAESNIKNVPNNAGAPYAGLNQMGIAERRTCGFTGSTTEWLAMTLVEQLPFVECFYDKNVKSFAHGDYGVLSDRGAIYVMNIAPALISHAREPSFPLYSSPSSQYQQNRQLDVGRKGYISVQDMKLAVDRLIAGRGPRWEEIKARNAALGGEVGAAVEPSSGVAGGVVLGLGILAVGSFAWAWYEGLLS